MSLLQKLRAKRFERLAHKLVVSGVKIQTENIPQQTAPSVSFRADEEGFLYLDDMAKISEKTNEMNWPFDMYIDTTKLIPGFVIYIISKQKPTKQRPWTVYKYEPRVITSIHDSGVNGGTVFFTFSHEIVQPLSLPGGKNENEFQIISDEDSIYSPLTKEHAQFICAELNSQSRSLYLSHLAKIKRKEK